MSQPDAGRFVPDPPRRGWFARNWLWFVPLIIITPALLCGGCFATIFYVAFTTVKSSPAYAQSVERVQQSAEVQAKLGQPIEVDTAFPSGKTEFDLTEGEGKAELYYDVKGPKGRASVVVEGEAVDFKWHFDKLEVTCDDGEKIDLSERHVPGGNEAPAFDPGAADNDAENAPPPPLKIDLE